MGRTIGNSFYRPGGLSGRLVLPRAKKQCKNWLWFTNDQG